MLQSYVTAGGGGAGTSPLWPHPSLGLVSWEDHAHRGGATTWSDYAAKTGSMLWTIPLPPIGALPPGPQRQEMALPSFLLQLPLPCAGHSAEWWGLGLVW